MRAALPAGPRADIREDLPVPLRAVRRPAALIPVDHRAVTPAAPRAVRTRAARLPVQVPRAGAAAVITLPAVVVAVATIHLAPRGTVAARVHLLVAVAAITLLRQVAKTPIPRTTAGTLTHRVR